MYLKCCSYVDNLWVALEGEVEAGLIKVIKINELRRNEK